MNFCEWDMARMLTPIIGIATVVIAYQQWRTNQRNEITNAQKLKHDLYEKRYAIYLAARSFLREIMRGKITDTMLFNYWEGTNAARFLLDEEMTVYLEEIEHKAIDLQTKAEEEAHGTPEFATGAKERGEMKKWFYEQISILNERFLPFLRLEN